MDHSNHTGPRLGRAEDLAQRLAQRIEQRLLLPGSRLPSVRAGAKQHGISPSTLVAAYDRLQALGLIEASPKRGFFVREPRATGAPRQAAVSARAALQPPPFDSLTLMRGLMSSGDKPTSAHGTLPPDWLDAAPLRQAMRQALAEPESRLLLGYGDPQGDALLREQLAEQQAGFGIPCLPEQILVTGGATQALDLVAQTLAQPGDAVLVDDPGWPIDFARLAQLGLRALPVPRGAQGPDLAVLAQRMQQHRPRLYLTVNVLHNPTGHSLSLAQAHELLRIAEAGHCLVVEDDTYWGFAPANLPRLAALDGLRRTLRISGFSKLIGAGLRVGYLAGPSALVERLTERKLVQQLASPALNERALARLLQRGWLRRHMERVNERLAGARARCQRHAEAAGCRFALPPAGLFGWLDAGVDSQRLAQRLAEQGLRIAAEPLFSPTRRAGPHLRVNFAASLEPAFWRALEQARRGLPRWE